MYLYRYNAILRIGFDIYKHPVYDMHMYLLTSNSSLATKHPRLTICICEDRSLGADLVERDQMTSGDLISFVLYTVSLSGSVAMLGSPLTTSF